MGWRVDECRLILGMLCIMGVRRVFCIVGMFTVDIRGKRPCGIL